MNPNQLAILFAGIYMVSYVTRTNFGAIIVEMEAATGFSKHLLSMSLTGSFVTYGAGQIISGILGDKISPKRLVSYGFLLTVVMNLLIPFCGSPYLMFAVWCVNGFAQSLMWPPLVKLMTALLSETDYKTTVSKVYWGSSFGTILVYLCSPLIIATLGWKWVFILSAGCGVLALAFWNRYCTDIRQEKTDAAKKVSGVADDAASKSAPSLFSALMIGIMAAIMMQGMLRDGVTTWMPSYISETYNLSSVISILTGVVLPIFSIVCFQIASRLYIKRFKNPLTCAAALFAVSTVSVFALYLFTGQSAAASVLLSAILTGCMHGVNLMLVSMIPPFFKRYGNVSTISGVLNSCTYIGSAVSTYGIAVLSEAIGWKLTILVWFGIALSGMLICLLCVRPWIKRFAE